MGNLFKKLWRTIWQYILLFVLVLFLLEFFKIRLDITKIFDALGIFLQVIVALLTFFAVLALYRLEGLRRLDVSKKEENEEKEGKKDYEKDIIKNLSKYGTRIAAVLFLFFAILLVSISNKSNFLSFEFKLHVDTIILSFLIVSIKYVLDGVISSLQEENLKSKS